MRRLNVVITGFGGVGRAAAALLLARRHRYTDVFDADVRLTGIRRARSACVDLAGIDDLASCEFSDAEGETFLEAAQADLLIEAGPSDFRTGGPGYGYMRQALGAGVHVVAISKGALVFDGPGLGALAARHGARLAMSGAAGAALPALDLITHSLAGCTVTSIEATLNATSNHLLTTMMDHGVGLDEALAAAQREGVAEADPRLDIEGWDAACKLLILVNFGMGAALGMGDLAVGGIQHVTRDQIDAWRAAGLSPRLVGYASRQGEQVRAGVELRTFDARSAFSHVPGKDKAVRIVTEEMGATFATGGGREPGATAAAALKDLEHILALG